ncbi:glycerol kinase GlpK [Microbacterium sp. TNHR37B]|uniref:glycerol kinase GlpK n=1 Tax=Microbacterium sp. TNHR37B TaxID=1775956 RepID=UPI0007B2858D|nr:glycerol kinase GlpK [Microbacterium sp. TNHR37B]KZE89907.1 Glycerol kinase [Microbacterium sp. TNHR37B]
MTRYILSIDQGTTSTRAIIFDAEARIVSVGQREHRQIFPRAGWVEHDPVEIWNNTREVVGLALTRANLTHTDLAAVGLTNQRETTVVWDRATGEPVHPAIVWQDTRTQALVEEFGGSQGPDRFAARVGLPLATYFAGPKLAWILRHVDGVRERAERGELLFGTMDTWLLWNLTGGVDGGIHVTDVTNASRTMLMDLETLEWSAEIAEVMGIPLGMLPEIRSSSELYGRGREHGLLPGVPIAGILGDQQAATFGQACFSEGMAKSTYGTGSFVLMNTGDRRVRSSHGLLTTVLYRLGDQPPVYALEGSVAVAGSLVQWLRDNIRMIPASADVEAEAEAVADNGGVYFVPAFSGLFAPHWRPDARGGMLGLTRYVTTGHIARAALEATAFQTREVIEAMNADSGVDLAELRVDGGMVANALLMQIQADQLGVDVIRPRISETTALGAAFAAGIAVGFWVGTQDVVDTWAEDRRWSPQLPAPERERLFRNWKKAVGRTLDWVDADTDPTH